MISKLDEKVRSLGGIRFVRSDTCPPTSDELNALASEFGFELSEVYKRFAMAYGGGMFVKWVDFPVLELSSGDPTPYRHIEMFLGGGAGKRNLRRIIGMYQGRGPDTLAPIATAPGGNLICLGAGHSELGKVYFWDHEREWQAEHPPSDVAVTRSMLFQSVILVANSFEDFIMSMEAKDISDVSLLARYEHDADGELVLRQVEEVFERTAYRLHIITLRSSTGIVQTSQTTTNEHPVYARCNKAGWKPANFCRRHDCRTQRRNFHDYRGPHRTASARHSRLQLPRAGCTYLFCACRRLDGGADLGA